MGTMSEFKFDSVEDLVEDIRQGKMVIITDDEHRENEGALIVAAAHATPQTITFMATYGRALVCVPLTAERAEALNLETTALHNDPFGTAFTQSVDAKDGVTTGISAYDRARTVQALIDPESGPLDFTSPGHIFPLIARPGGVLRRAGHTEAAVDLARLAGLTPAAVTCDIMNDDGTMAGIP